MFHVKHLPEEPPSGPQQQAAPGRQLQGETAISAGEGLSGEKIHRRPALPGQGYGLGLAGGIGGRYQAPAGILPGKDQQGAGGVKPAERPGLQGRIAVSQSASRRNQSVSA